MKTNHIKKPVTIGTSTGSSLLQKKDIPNVEELGVAPWGTAPGLDGLGASGAFGGISHVPKVALACCVKLDHFIID